MMHDRNVAGQDVIVYFAILNPSKSEIVAD
jgi:hypothetical protein